MASGLDYSASSIESSASRAEKMREKVRAEAQERALRRRALRGKACGHLLHLEAQFAGAMERATGDLDRTFVAELLGAIHALRAEIEHLKE